eukprot:2949643-Ditylum_brightwellii.AAC.3
MPTTTWVPQTKLRDITAQPGITKAVPNNTSPSRSHTLILYNADEVEPCQQDHESVQPCPTPRKYTLCKRAVNIMNSVICEESPNVTSISSPPKHINKYSSTLKHIVVQESFKHEMYTPKGMIIGAITDPKTGKQLEYQDLVQDTHYKAVW